MEWDGLRLDILLPLSSDDLIDVSEFNDDERLPYWAELWPAARALAGYLQSSDRTPDRALELGCGVGLPSLVLAALGWEPLATDYYPEALEFVKINAERNGIPTPGTALLDWRWPPRGIGRFSLVLAADVLYEQRNVASLAGILEAVVDPRGEVLLADPGRKYLGDLLAHMAESGWNTAHVETREMAPVTDDARPSHVQIWRLEPPRQTHTP